jgi:hypothetical protein
MADLAASQQICVFEFAGRALVESLRKDLVLFYELIKFLHPCAILIKIVRLGVIAGGRRPLLTMGVINFAETEASFL